MSEHTLVRQESYKHRTPVIIFAVVALLCVTANNIATFFLLHVFDDIGIKLFDALYSSRPTLSIPMLILTVVPNLLLVVHVVNVRNGAKARTNMAIILGLVALITVYHRVERFAVEKETPEYYFGEWIISVLIVVAFALAAISAFKRFKNVVFLVVAVATVLAVEYIDFINTLRVIYPLVRLLRGLKYVAIYLAGTLGTVAFCIALLLYGLNNRASGKDSVAQEEIEKQLE